MHFHLLVLDGVYRREGEGKLRFVPVPAPDTEEFKQLVQRIAEQIGRSLERSGLITRDIENASGFSLHAGIAAKASQRDKLEHLARYVPRPPVATERILKHLGGDGEIVGPAHPSRAPPQGDLSL